MLPKTITVTCKIIDKTLHAKYGCRHSRKNNTHTRTPIGHGENYITLE